MLVLELGLGLRLAPSVYTICSSSLESMIHPTRRFSYAVPHPVEPVDLLALG